MDNLEYKNTHYIDKIEVNIHNIFRDFTWKYPDNSSNALQKQIFLREQYIVQKNAIYLYQLYLDTYIIIQELEVRFYNIKALDFLQKDEWINWGIGMDVLEPYR